MGNPNKQSTRLTGVMVLITAAIATACSGPRNYTNDNDRLRRENLELQKQIKTLEEKLDLKIAEIETYQPQSATGLEDVEPLRAVRVKLARYSGGVDRDDDGRDDLLRLHVHILDQHGQFIPVAGKATIQCTVVAAGRQPAVLAEKQYDPQAFRQAYRSGLTGTHYTFELDLPGQAPAWQEQQTTAVVYLSITDAATGAVLQATETVKIDLRPLKSDTADLIR